MPLADLLLSSAPDPERPDGARLYDFLVGDWDADIRSVDDDGHDHRGKGRIAAGWILEGRAIQDVWTIDEPAPMPVAGKWFGTTLRIFDRSLGVWRILWADPLRNDFRSQIGVPHGADIVQEQDVDGVRSRWSFRDITADRFIWRGEVSKDLGASWALKVEVAAQLR